MFTKTDALQRILLETYGNLSDYKRYLANPTVQLSNTHMLLCMGLRGKMDDYCFYTLDKATYQVRVHPLEEKEFLTNLERVFTVPANFAYRGELTQAHRLSLETLLNRGDFKELIDLECFQWFLRRHPEFKLDKQSTVALKYSDGNTTIVIHDRWRVEVNGSPMRFKMFYRGMDYVRDRVHEIEEFRVGERFEWWRGRLYKTKTHCLRISGLDIYWINLVNLTEGKVKCKDLKSLNDRLTDFITFDSVVGCIEHRPVKYTFPVEVLNWLLVKGALRALEDDWSLEQLKTCLDLMLGYEISTPNHIGTIAITVPGFTIRLYKEGGVKFSKTTVRHVAIGANRKIEWVGGKKGTTGCILMTNFITALKAVHKANLTK